MKTKTLVISIAALLSSATAFAEQTASDTPPPKARLEEVMVQARRETENIQVVPVAVSSVSAEQIEKATLGSVQDLQRLVPNLQISTNNTGSQNYVIRGSFTDQFTDPSVITYFDEVAIDPRVLAYNLFDVASVQQLKGPQGTLFGKNSTGGAILMFGREPEHELGGYFRGRFGSFNEKRVEGALNVPITDTLAFRIAGENEKRDGIIKSVTSNNEYDNRDNYAVRATLLWNPTDNIENKTQITNYNVNETLSPNIAYESAPLLFGRSPINGSTISIPNPAAAYTQQQQTLGRFKTVNDSPYNNDYHYQAGTNITTVDFDLLSIKNIAYYGEISQGFQRDFDGTPAINYQTGVDGHARTISDEIQIYGTALQDMLTWRVGGTYSDEHKKEFFTPAFALVTVVPAPPFPPIGLTAHEENTTINDATSKALFGQVTYDFSELVLDGLKATAGYRRTWDHRELRKNDYLLAPLNICNIAGLSTGTAQAQCNQKLQDDFGDDNYNFTLEYAINPDMFTYVATRKGYKSGGFNTSTNDPRFIRYDSELVTDYELGLKSNWVIADMPVRLNVAVFEAKYTDIQTSAVVSNGGGGLGTVIVNKNPNTGKSTEATFRGHEVEFAIAPTAWWELSGFYSHLMPTWDTAISSSGRDLSGTSVDQRRTETSGLTSKMTTSAPGDLGGELSLNIIYSYTSKSTQALGGFVNGVRAEQVDTRIDWTGIGGTSVDIGVYGKNVFDHQTCDQVLFLNTQPIATNFQACHAPREYGIEIGYHFE